MPTSSNDLRGAIAGIFERTRQTPNMPYEPERLGAFLTHPPAPGKRVADTFAGRRRWVRFMAALQLEMGICFTQEEWERGFGLDDLAALTAAKQAKPDQGLRLARKRLEDARRRRTGEPLRFALLMLPILIGVVAADAWPAKAVLLLLWVAGVGLVAWLSFSEVRYSRELVRRIEGLQ
jgi:hypothetical protein